MANERTTEDKLRHEYAELYPDLLKEHHSLLVKVKWYLRSLIYKLNEYERIEIESRIKDCESAINSLKRRYEWGFQPGNNYTITDLKDLVGVRILVFPKKIIKPVVTLIEEKLTDWKPDHEKHGKVKIFKYDNCINKRKKIQGEIQILPMLTGLFWKVEHFAFYKPHPSLHGIKHSPGMKTLYKEVLEKLADFEMKFENEVKKRK